MCVVTECNEPFYKKFNLNKLQDLKTRFLDYEVIKFTEQEKVYLSTDQGPIKLTKEDMHQYLSKKSKYAKMVTHSALYFTTRSNWMDNKSISIASSKSKSSSQINRVPNFVIEASKQLSKNNLGPNKRKTVPLSLEHLTYISLNSFIYQLWSVFAKFFNEVDLEKCVFFEDHTTSWYNMLFILFHEQATGIKPLCLNTFNLYSGIRKKTAEITKKDTLVIIHDEFSDEKFPLSFMADLSDELINNNLKNIIILTPFVTSNISNLIAPLVTQCKISVIFVNDRYNKNSLLFDHKAPHAFKNVLDWTKPSYEMLTLPKIYRKTYNLQNKLFDEQQWKQMLSQAKVFTRDK